MKYGSRIIRLVAILLAGLSLYFLLLSSATIKIDNTHEMARTVINRSFSKSEDAEIKSGVEIVKESGLEDLLISGLPKHVNLKFSYADVYHLTSVYDDKGKVSTGDLGLKAKNRLEDVINRFIVEAINAKLREESRQVHHLISIYRYSIFVIILLYILSTVLMWLKRYTASIPLLLGSIISFGALWYFCNEANNELQSTVYKGISIQLEAGIWTGLIIGIVLAIAWLFLLKWIKRNDASHA
ncbi:hypothetical protein LA664_04570 [Lactobacillus amylolyticus]|uniref:Uncharacterized protein n=1 Tax=Lactobacillus amylolyticus DSM 11664 TaxID=585524 RepID=D4YTZ8_9LACO|nr:hypothetical protein [Lactobacillus amylolyticus]EFG55318.1 hypothetical protein HMPREF0493_1009 [Lactobacillus amylolyticus DSM 11664]KRL18236.1 hypothetical protein FD39_GL000540 [Lactobacillus amylolyticus DSM 11664]QFY04544.1 hypothetical protein LA664_04570 [Lactobacillus amylolyticus]TDG64030.1 hypothetical protein C5L18_000884 [Lactobacillus amylolyticus]